MATTPLISPIGNGRNGKITVTGDFQMFGGKIQVGISGPEPKNDKVVVFGHATLSGTVFGTLNPIHDAIPAGTKIRFLQSNKLIGDFSAKTPPGAKWTYGKTDKLNDIDTSYYFSPTEDIKVALGAINGRVWNDDTGLARGSREPCEASLGGVTVKLLDEDGANELAFAVTDSNGHYTFGDLDAGTYQVAFSKPTGKRASPQGKASVEFDSDPNPLTGRVTVTVGAIPAGGGDPVLDITDIDAGYYSNAVPIAVDDAYSTPVSTTVMGSVATNDTDDDNDTLTVTLTTGPAHGTLTLNANGSFTYTPTAGYVGADTFTYSVDDGFGGTDTATTTITVIPTATASGVVWRDDNGDGTRAGWGAMGESWLSGVVVTLTGQGRTLTATTGAGGAYSFAGLAPGSYTATVTIPTGFSAVSPTVTFGVVAGTNPTIPDFYLRPDNAVVSGVVWRDTDWDGTRAGGGAMGESGLNGLTVTLTGPGGTRTTTTGGGGAYSFTGLAAGTYTATIAAPPSGYSAVSTSGTVAVVWGQTAAVPDFYLRPDNAVVSGVVWRDTDWDGTRAGGGAMGESGLNGLTVTLTGPGGTRTTTTAGGDYSFTGLAAGTYTATITTPTGYSAVGTSGTVTVAGGQTAIAPDFYLQPI